MTTAQAQVSAASNPSQRPAAASASGHARPPFIAHPAGRPVPVHQSVNQLLVGRPLEAGHSRWQLEPHLGGLLLRQEPEAWRAEPAHLLAAAESAFNLHPELAEISLQLAPGMAAPAWSSGAATPDGPAQVTLERAAFWQQAGVWRSGPEQPYPERHMISHGRRHPRRPPKPAGVVYRRYIPWLAQTLELRGVDIDADLPRFSAWMNDPVVAHFWQEQGDLAKHRAYLEGVAADARVLPLIGSFDGQPFGYFEAYWAKEDRIAPFYDADDYDRGWHALVGEPAFRGKPFLTAWMPSVSHYLFLDDCRTRRIVIEPRADNARMINSLARCGYALLKEFDFPHKRAMLGMLLRERFFGEALWQPRDTPAAAQVRPALHHAHS